jgi:hypothetical protein
VVALMRHWVDDERSRGAGPLPVPPQHEGEAMSLADSSYPLLNIFWSMFIFFLWII